MVYVMVPPTGNTTRVSRTAPTPVRPAQMELGTLTHDQVALYRSADIVSVMTAPSAGLGPRFRATTVKVTRLPMTKL